MEFFLRIVGRLYVAAGLLGIVFSVCVFTFTDAWIALMQVLSSLSNVRSYPVSTLFLAFLAFHAFLVAIPTLVSGLGLLRRKEWSRDLAVVSAVLQLPGVPLGTALGIFSLWALFVNASGSYFHQEDRPDI